MAATARHKLPGHSRTGRDEVQRVIGGRGWFATMPAGLLTAISASGQRTDLVTIPPNTSEQDATAAMAQATEVGSREHAPAILAALRAAALPAAGPGSS